MSTRAVDRRVGVRDRTARLERRAARSAPVLVGGHGRLRRKEPWAALPGPRVPREAPAPRAGPGPCPLPMGSARWAVRGRRRDRLRGRRRRVDRSGRRSSRRRRVRGCRRRRDRGGRRHRRIDRRGAAVVHRARRGHGLRPMRQDVGEPPSRIAPPAISTIISHGELSTGSRWPGLRSWCSPRTSAPR